MVDGYFASGFIETNDGWIHVALVYSGPNDGQGIRVYHNGAHQRDDTAKYPQATGTPPGILKIGKRYDHLGNAQYGRVTVDELTLWNRQLSEKEIQSIMALK